MFIKPVTRAVKTGICYVGKVNRQWITLSEFARLINVNPYQLSRYKITVYRTLIKYNKTRYRDYIDKSLAIKQLASAKTDRPVQIDVNHNLADKTRADNF